MDAGKKPSIFSFWSKVNQAIEKYFDLFWEEKQSLREKNAICKRDKDESKYVPARKLPLTPSISVIYEPG